MSSYLFNRSVGKRVARGYPEQVEQGKLPYFCPSKQRINMGHDHDHHDHSEAEQNEIGGPVVFALFLFAIVITTIYFLS